MASVLWSRLLFFFAPLCGMENGLGGVYAGGWGGLGALTTGREVTVA